MRLKTEDRASREEAADVGRAIRALLPQTGFRATLGAALSELIAIFNARSALLIAHDTAHDRMFIYESGAAPVESSVRSAELESHGAGTYLFPAPAVSWYAVRRNAAHGSFEVHDGAPDCKTRRAAHSLPDRFLTTHPCRSLLVKSFTVGEIWNTRLFLLDARVGLRPLRRLDAIVTHVAPIIYNVALVGRLRARTGAAERARVARELHDGIIQSLIGLEMQVDVWRREAPATAAVAHFCRIQEILRKEVLDLRDLIQHMRPVAVDGKHVLEYLAALVDAFQRHSGIEAHFVSEVGELTLSPPVCGEIVRIVQEALVNVRKHSGARHVVVRVSSPPGHWKFEVDDDGRGFDFAGRHSQSDLDLARKGPVVIKERVRSIGGQLAVESSPGQGARLEVWLPRGLRG